MSSGIVHEHVAQAFRARARDRGDHEAVVLVRDPDDPGTIETWTYRRLDERAAVIAKALVGMVCQGERVLLTFPSGPWFAAAFLGCLYAGAIAVPAPFPARTRPQKRRLGAIAADADVSAVLAQSDDRNAVDGWLADEGPRDVMPVFVDELDGPAADQSELPTIDIDAVAFLQYTSGSTGDAKGVALTHENILANCATLYRATAVPPERLRLVCWLPLYHDMGLIGQLLSPLLYGGTSILLDPFTVVRRPYRWLRTIDRFAATVSASPDFGFRLCLERVTDEQVERLDLSSWEVATNGADWLEPSTMREFVDRFAPAGLHVALCPAYGLAEATLLVASRRAETLQVLDADRDALDGGVFEPAGPGVAVKRVVSCGPGHEIDIAIVNPDTRETLPADRVGEIWLSGQTVARGYWRREVETRESFGAITAEGKGPCLRSGDLGFRHHGELYVTGRIKEVVVVRGQKIYPQDIESVLRAEVPRLPGAATVLGLPGTDSGPDRIVVACEMRHGSVLEPSELDALGRDVVHVVAREFGAPVAAVSVLRPGGIERTTSGKVKRVEMRERYRHGAWNPIHEYLH